MEARIRPSILTGAARAVPSKSVAHRLLILDALTDDAQGLDLACTNDDIEATRRCLKAMGGIVDAQPAESAEDVLTLDVGESGSTLRFLLPQIGARGLTCRIVCHGRLAERPLVPFDDELRAHGMAIERTEQGLHVAGRLRGGTFTLPGNVSSQYVSALLMAAPALDVPTEVLVAEPVESAPYIALTASALSRFAVDVEQTRVMRDGHIFSRYHIAPTTLETERPLTCEGDWSAAAFLLAAGALEREGVTVMGLDPFSVQGDRAILAALASLGARVARRRDAVRVTRDCPRPATMDVSAIPDLVPPLAAVAATTPGETMLTNAARLRLKESDRLETVTAAIRALGGDAEIVGDALRIRGVGRLAGGVVDAAGDHRIAMMGAVMATHAQGQVTVLGAECVAKSWPGFWEDYAALGGDVTLS